MIQYNDAYSTGNPLRQYDDSPIPSGIKSFAQSLQPGVATYPGSKVITLTNLIQMAALLNSEVGVLLDTTINTICVTRGGQSTAQNIGGAVSLPTTPAHTFVFIAHVHPTTSPDKSQVTNDMRNTAQQVEMVVNMAGLIMYVSNGYCYNTRDGNNLLPKLQARVTNSASFLPGTIGIDKPINPQTLTTLGVDPN